MTLRVVEKKEVILLKRAIEAMVAEEKAGKRKTLAIDEIKKELDI
jgi:hypothetical protein